MSHPAAPKAPRRLLIVDDADEPRNVLAVALGTIDNVIVETANNAHEALRLMSARAADIVVTDFRMPGMNGLELLLELRESKLWPRCGAIVVSAETDPDLPQRARACGASLFCRKPFSAGAIRRSVISLLEECNGKA